MTQILFHIIYDKMVTEVLFLDKLRIFSINQKVGYMLSWAREYYNYVDQPIRGYYLYYRTDDRRGGHYDFLFSDNHNSVNLR